MSFQVKVQDRERNQSMDRLTDDDDQNLSDTQAVCERKSFHQGFAKSPSKVLDPTFSHHETFSRLGRGRVPTDLGIMMSA